MDEKPEAPVLGDGLSDCSRCESSGSPGERVTGEAFRVALLGNPNTGKTTLFNRLSGLRAKTSNFPGTTQDARVGMAGSTSSGQIVELIDLPGIYSLELEQSEALVCREILAGRLAPRGERAGDPDAVLVVADATNLARNLVFIGEVLRRRLPTVVAINMIDLASKSGVDIDAGALSLRLGCRVELVSARNGDGVSNLIPALEAAKIPNQTPPGTIQGLESWADEVYGACAHPSGEHADHHDARGSGTEGAPDPSRRVADLTDRIDRVTMHPVLGPALLAGVMAGLFYSIFSLAAYPMDWIEMIFDLAGGAAVRFMPEGILADLLANGVVKGIGATVVFVPQICLLFFLMSLLEDTGYLARGALLMDLLLRPFGLPGHAFVPLLGSHACALPGIMATRGIPDFRDRLATILVAPFVTCSARLPVYVLLVTLLFRDRPFAAALAFVGCYLLGIAAALFSAMIARRTILRGASRPMILELPTYKVPSLRTAFLTTLDRGWNFIRNAGTNILAICIVLWWLGSYPRVAPPIEAQALATQAAEIRHDNPDAADELTIRSDALIAKHARTHSFAGMIGRTAEPIFAPLGYDWQLSIGVISSFAAREVFVSTLAVVTTGNEDSEDAGIQARVQSATRDDGSPIFTRATAWSLLVYYVLAMQCLPTLAVTAREARGVRWAILQLAWMSGVAYLAALVTFQSLNAGGVS